MDAERQRDDAFRRVGEDHGSVSFSSFAVRRSLFCHQDRRLKLHYCNSPLLHYGNNLWVHSKNAGRPKSTSTSAARSCVSIGIRSAPGRSDSAGSCFSYDDGADSFSRVAPKWVILRHAVAIRFLGPVIGRVQHAPARLWPDASWKRICSALEHCNPRVRRAPARKPVV